MTDFNETRESGALVIAKDGIVRKTHKHPADYRQERFFYELLLPYKFSFLPEWVHFTDTKQLIEMPDCGKQLEEFCADNPFASLTTFLPRALADMRQVWELNRSVEPQYVYDNDRMARETIDFLSRKYEELFNRMGLPFPGRDQFVSSLGKCLERLFARNRDAHIIHFDLFAGNILLDQQSQLKIVDWSGARQASLVNEFAILYAKLDLADSLAQSILSRMSEEFGIDFVDVETLGAAYLVLRKSRKNTGNNSDDLGTILETFAEDYLR